MLKVEIKDAYVTKRNGNKNGKDWEMRTQEAWAHTLGRSGQPNAYPEKITVTLEADEQGHPVGFYQLMPQTIYVGDYGSLRLGRLILQPIAANAQKATA